MNDFTHLPVDLELRAARTDELGTLVRLDDAAGVLYERAGMLLSLSGEHPFVVEESNRWRSAIERGHGRVLVTKAGQIRAFAIFGEVDGHPYLDQLSVHPEHMRLGLGRALLAWGIEWAGERDLWLTTYAHLPWNAPYYQRFGFEVVREEACGPGVRDVLRRQRAALPEPRMRTAMVRRKSSSLGSSLG